MARRTDRKRKNGSTFFEEVRSPRSTAAAASRSSATSRGASGAWSGSEVGAFLNMIFNSIRDPFCIFDSDYQIIRINEPTRI